MIVRLAVGQSSLLVVPVAQEGFLALGAHEVLHMPVLPQRRDHSLLNWPTTGTTNGNTHFIMAAQTIQFILFRNKYKYINIT